MGTALLPTTPVVRTECDKCLALRSRYARQPGDIHALIVTVRAQAAQLGCTCRVPETHRAIGSTTCHESAIPTHCHAPHPRGVLPGWITPSPTFSGQGASSGSRTSIAASA